MLKISLKIEICGGLLLRKLNSRKIELKISGGGYELNHSIVRVDAVDVLRGTFD